MIGRASLLLLLVASRAHAETPLEARLDQAARAYRSCVLGAAADLARSPIGSLQFVAEQAFLACSTEEQAIRATFRAAGSPAAVTESAILQTKLSLKNIITFQH